MRTSKGIGFTSMICRAFLIEPWTSKENRASTSVETFPGTICRISLPNSTSRRSSVESIFSSKSLPCACHCQYLRDASNVEVTDMILSVCNGNIHKLCVFWLFGRGENERGICGSILWLILSDGSKVTRVTDDSGANGFQLFKRASHDLIVILSRYVLLSYKERWTLFVFCEKLVARQFSYAPPSPQ